jgi:hypothetical protein
LRRARRLLCRRRMKPRSTPRWQMFLWAFLVVGIGGGLALAAHASNPLVVGVVMTFVGAAVVAAKTRASMKHAALAYLVAGLIWGSPVGVASGVLVSALVGSSADVGVIAVAIAIFVAIPWVIGCVGHFVGLLASGRQLDSASTISTSGLRSPH